ncbi:MAG TPA: glycosyltransferase family 2 protein [Bacteroidales bacterium]|nr:glycosyltransferase family 2 protein [Bacteroidales bacterium]
MKIAVLLPVHNHLELTVKALHELKRVVQEYTGIIELVVIDDGSTDGTYDYVSRNYSFAHIIKGDGNMWWSGAINVGARYAIEKLQADYLVLWNNDISYKPDYFEKIVETIPTLGLEGKEIIGSKILVYERPDLVWSMGGCFNPINGKYKMYGYYQNDSEKYKQMTPVDWLTGMGTIVPRKVIETIGYWDNVNFPQYHGDSDFTYRAKLKGFSIIVHPELIIYNKVGNSGIQHNGSFKQLMRMMTDLRSKTNFSKNLKFYKLYARSVRAYYPLFVSYMKIFGGYFKWKLLKLAGIKKKVIVNS